MFYDCIDVKIFVFCLLFWIYGIFGGVVVVWCIVCVVIGRWMFVWFNGLFGVVVVILKGVESFGKVGSGCGIMYCYCRGRVCGSCGILNFDWLFWVIFVGMCYCV